MKLADTFSAYADATSNFSQRMAGYALAEKDVWPSWAGPIHASPVIMFAGFYLVRSLGSFMAFTLDKAHRGEDYRGFAKQFALSVLWFGVYAAVALLLTPEDRTHRCHCSPSRSGPSAPGGCIPRPVRAAPGGWLDCRGVLGTSRSSTLLTSRADDIPEVDSQPPGGWRGCRPDFVRRRHSNPVGIGAFGPHLDLEHQEVAFLRVEQSSASQGGAMHEDTVTAGWLRPCEAIIIGPAETGCPIEPLVLSGFGFSLGRPSVFLRQEAVCCGPNHHGERPVVWKRHSAVLDKVEAVSSGEVYRLVLVEEGSTIPKVLCWDVVQCGLPKVSANLGKEAVNFLIGSSHRPLDAEFCRGGIVRDSIHLAPVEVNEETHLVLENPVIQPRESHNVLPVAVEQPPEDEGPREALEGGHGVDEVELLGLEVHGRQDGGFRPSLAASDAGTFACGVHGSRPPEDGSAQVEDALDVPAEQPKVHAREKHTLTRGLCRAGASAGRNLGS